MALRPGRNARQTLEDLIELFEPRIRDAFLVAIQDVTDNAIIEDMIKAIENGDPEAAFRAVGFSPAAMEPLIAAIETAFERGGVLTGASFPRYMQTPSGRAVFRFDVRNSRAEAWLRDHSSQLVTRISNDIRQNIQTVLQSGMTEGRNPRAVALDLVGYMTTVVNPETGQSERHRVGGIIGLTPGQERWVANARRDLMTLDPRYLNRELRNKRYDNIVERAIRDGRPLPGETIEKIVTAYKNNALRYRGETIARTEAMQSLNRSEWEAVMQAVDTGALRRQDVTRHWDSAADTRVRFSHHEMDDKYAKDGVGLDEPFVSPSGARMMYPGDTSLGAPGEEVINCRCRVRLKVDFLAQWNNDPNAPRRTSILPAAPPPETPAQRNARLDAEMKAYVLERGRAADIEYLWAYDRKTGEQLGQNHGTKSNVGFTPEFAQAMASKEREIIAHHNHPSSRSFSFQDLWQVTNAPGLSGLWAHGHNGSSYYATRGTRAEPITKEIYDRTSDDVRRELQTLINNTFAQDRERANALVTAAGRLHAHAVSELLARQNYIEYEADLQDETAAAMEVLQEWFTAYFKRK